MSNIDKQALRLTAEKAKDNFMPNFMVPTRDLLALLDELEAAEKTSAARLEALDRTHKMYQREKERVEAAEKYAKDRDAENKDLMLTVGRLRVE
ncbi:hypothetical protein AADB37_001991, partial [Enterobacter hormaechei]